MPDSHARTSRVPDPEDAARRLIDDWSKELRDAINRAFAPLVRLAHDWDEEADDE